MRGALLHRIVETRMLPFEDQTLELHPTTDKLAVGQDHLDRRILFCALTAYKPFFCTVHRSRVPASTIENTDFVIWAAPADKLKYMNSY